MNYHISFDDYCEENWKLAKLLLKHELQATFFIQARLPDGDQRTPKAQIEALSNLGFDIGCHTIDHKILTQIEGHDDEAIENELYLQIAYAKGLIQDWTGKECEWFCPPRGRYNDRVIEIAREAGFKYIRTTKLNDSNPPIEGLVHTTFHVFNRPEYQKSMQEYYMDLRLPRMECFKVWGHGWEIEKHNAWQFLDNIFSDIGAEL